MQKKKKVLRICIAEENENPIVFVSIESQEKLESEEKQT